MPSSDNHFSFLHFFFLGMFLVTASCTVLQTSIHSSSSTLANLVPWIYLPLPLYNHKGFYLGHTWMALVFPTFFNLSLNLVIGVHDLTSSQFQVLFLLTVNSISIFVCKEYNQSDFSNDHLVMSLCRVVSCVVGRGYLLWPVHSLGKTLLAFSLLHFTLQGQTCLLHHVSLDSLFLHSSPLWWWKWRGFFC